MTNFLMLTKINIKNMLSEIFSFGKKSAKTAKKSKPKIGIVALILLLAVALMTSFGSMFLRVAQLLKPFGMTSYVFILGGFTALLITLFIITFEAYSHIYKSKDYEMLACLPISNFALAMSKFVSVLVSGYLYSMIILLPCMVVYFIFAGFSIAILFTNILGMLFFPIIPCAIGTVLGLFIAYLSSKTKHSNIITILASILLTVTYVFVGSQLTDVADFFMEKGASLLTVLNYIMPSVSFYVTGLVELNTLHILWYVLINLGVLLLLTLLISLTYGKVNFALAKTKVASAKEITYNSSSVTSSLLKKELKGYLSTPVYFMNTAILLIFLLAMPFLMKFSDISAIFTIPGFEKSGVFTVAILSSLFMVASCNTTSVSISLEGKNFYMLKSLPISTKKVFFTKIAFNVLVAVPFILVSSSLFSIMFFNELMASGTLLGILNIFLLYFLPIIASITFATFGLFVNLWLPKINFLNPTQVVKQSASTLVGMVGSIMFNMLLITVYFSFLFNTLSIYWFLLILSVLYIIIFLTFAFLINKKGVAMFNKIS